MAVKEYTVKKDGVTIKTYKSLPAAKNLAEKELAIVYCGDVVIYRTVPDEETDTTDVTVDDSETSGAKGTTTSEEEEADTSTTDTTDTSTEDPSTAETTTTSESDQNETAERKENANNEDKDGTSNKFVLTGRMNVRNGPSLKARIIKVYEAGTVVEVKEIVDDWLYLTDGTFILYQGGEFAQAQG